MTTEERLANLEQALSAQNILYLVNRALQTGALNIGGTSADSTGGALLSVTSVNKGILFPRMTTTQRDAVVNPVQGLVIFNTSTGVLNFYNGSAWGAV